MSRILLTWELGRGYGHSSRLALLARSLRQRGHDVVLALRDLADSTSVLPAAEFRTFQTPLWIGDIGGLPPPANFAEVLIRFGFLAPESLHGVARAWRTMVDAIQPDLILFDHAPTGLLATRGLGIPRAVFGDGFCVPPLTDPWPAFRWWTNTAPARLDDATRRVLVGVNSVLHLLGLAKIERLSDLYRTEATFLLTLEAIDHYPQRCGVRYWGPVCGTAAGSVNPRWPIVGHKRVFAYLEPSAGYFEPVVRALAAQDVSALIFAPGISARMASGMSSAGIAISGQPFDMDRIVDTCDAAVTQAGMGTASALLLAGKPQLMIPSLLERGMLAKRISDLGAGLLVAGDQAKADYGLLVKRLLHDAALHTAARAFAQEHARVQTAAIVEEIADHCASLAAGSPLSVHGA